MFLRKTPVLPLIAAAAGVSALPAVAQVDFLLSTNKVYRQQKGQRGNWTSQTYFEGGNFNAELYDGSAVYVGGCVWNYYFPANSSIFCPGGSTAFVTFGNLDAAVANQFPYYWITDIQDAIIIEPRFPQLCQLVAAPASELRRPLGGFVDDSFGIYYNLHTTEVKEYVITRYAYQRNYTNQQEGAFQKQIVPGVYHYEFPRLDNPELAGRISPTIYPIPEGTQKINNKKTGVLFNTKGRWKGKKGYSNRWNAKGFYELSYVYPNTIKWSGFSPSEVFPAVDNLYISLRYLSQPSNPKSAVTYTSPNGVAPASIFPTFEDAGDPRILLDHAYVTQFTLPPIFNSGTKGVIELELDRDLPSSSIATDVSTRRFRLPFKVVNYYSEFKELNFGSSNRKGKTSILRDYDKDGYNNLTEWIMESSPDDPEDFPDDTFPTYHQEKAPGGLERKLATVSVQTAAWILNQDVLALDPLPWYGYMLRKHRAAVPAVNYILQRSTDGGQTWRRMRQDADWFVVNNKNYVGFASRRYGQGELYEQAPGPIIPQGTTNHQYRIKVVLKKK